METKEVKKRGRKPKKVDKTIDEVVKKPQKRGRKPKDKYSITNNKLTNQTTELSSVILHLPINSKDIDNDFVEKQILQYSPEIKSPKPYDKNMSIQPYNTYSNSPYPFDSKLTNKDDNHNNNNDDEQDSELFKETLYQLEMNEEEKDLSQEDNSLSEINNNLQNNNDLDTVDKNITLYDSLSSNVKNVYNIKTADLVNPLDSNIHCYWCCHSFKEKPIGLPISYKDNIFSTIGHFCSPECACAYNFDSNNLYDDVWYRYTLLNYMCSLLWNDSNINIKRAPSRYILNTFGGPLTIDEFRKNNQNYSIDYKILDPPFICVVSQVNEIHVNTKTNKFIPIDKDRIKTATEELKLKRNKPITEKKNTLENCMKLTYL